MKIIVAVLALFAPLFAIAGTADAPRIEMIKQSQQTLWQFLSALPASMEAQVLYGLVLAGVIGMCGHYFMQWVRGGISGSLWRYLFIDYPRGTLLALAGVFGASLTALAANVFVTDAGDFVGWLNVLWFGLTQGYAADSVANKGQPKP